jgi:outer membrane protein OmpU
MEMEMSASSPATKFSPGHVLGTTALFGMAAAGPVLAQTASEPIKLQINGHFLGTYGDLLSQSGAAKKGRRNDDIFMDNLLEFNGKTKLDNGLTVGVMFQFRAQNLPQNTGATPGFPGAGSATADRVKRDWVSFAGDFGEFRLGDMDDVRHDKAVTGPVPGGGALFGANTPTFEISNNPIGTNTTMRSIGAASRVSRLFYVTPTIAGFGFGVSYAPGGEKGGNAFAGGNVTSVDRNVNAVNNEVSGVVTYHNKFDAFKIDAASGISVGHRITTTGSRNNPQSINVGADVGFGPFTVGGAFENSRNPAAVTPGSQARENNVFEAGVMFETGPFGVGLDWSRGLYRGAISGVTPVLDVISLSTDYKLGPGIQVGVALDYTRYRSHATSLGDGGLTDNYSGLALMVATGVFF